MDINTIGTVTEDSGIVVHLKDVEGELLFDGDGEKRTPVTMLVAGTYSDRYRKAQKKFKDKNLRLARRNQDFDAEALDEGNLGLEVACILEWPFTANDKVLPISVENWKAVIQKQPQWQGQVQAAMNDHAAFFSKSSPR